MRRSVKEEAQRTLEKAFARLGSKEKENLRWHAANKTPIVCGKQANLYADGKGGG